MKQRLDQLLVSKGFCQSRSQAENFIKLKKVTVNGKLATKPGLFVASDADINLDNEQKYVSRAGLKLASVAQILNLDFKDKTMLDIGSSTGGFTDYALPKRAKKGIAVDVGTNQLHPSLKGNEKIELHEKTDIRDFKTKDKIDIIVIDVSFISLRLILPYVRENLSDMNTKIIAMLKPQFEAGKNQINKGIIKNETTRRQILKEFEIWAKDYFVINNKRDSSVSGAKGNNERFYLLTRTK